MSDSVIPRTMAYMNVGHSFSHLVMLLFPTVVLALEPAWQTPYVDLLPLGFAGYLFFGLGALPAGWLGDRWDSGKLMVLFFIGTPVSCALAGFAEGPISLALALTLIGLFASIYHPVALACTLPIIEGVYRDSLGGPLASTPTRRLGVYEKPV